MTSSSFINALIDAQNSTGRIQQKIGGFEIEFFIQPATIFDVEDPDNLCRVRVLFDENATDAKSDWLPVLNNGKGRISSQYLGSKCIVGAVSGNTDNAIILGLFNDTTSNQLISSAPVTFPIIDVSDISNISDPGAKCNRENEGKAYVFSNNVSQDLKICVRRNNRQNDPEADVWEWKGLTRGLVIEKSQDPKQVVDSSVKIDTRPVPRCNEKLEGEIIQFSEDRDFRQFPVICKKDENKEWAWVPVSAPPVFFKTTLPKCSEKIHGQTAVIDDGNNSEMGICLRLDKNMTWVKYGTRTPITFSDVGEQMLKKTSMVKSALPNNALGITENVLEIAEEALTKEKTSEIINLAFSKIFGG
jgi:hypothetical protein